MEEIRELLVFCDKISNDRLLVQAAGGNASYKSSNQLFVKASGHWLKDVLEKKILTTLSMKELNKKITPKEILKIRKEFRSKVLARNIYSEVLNIIQPIVIYKLKKKKDKKNRKYLEDALLTSIAGISAAMKNTG